MSTTQSPASEAPTPLPEGTARLVRNRHGALPPLVLAHDQGAARPLIEPIVIGSSPAADLRVQDIYMSGRHARIRPVEDALIIEDLGSTNGTFLDGLRVARAWLQPGSQLRLGGWHCRIQATESAASLTVSAGEHGMVGASPAFLDMLQALVRFAPLVRPVLLTGETGTGK
ncbi:MAG: FHA domain-containing protein, partial [Myxococcales bacterium]|nr:FHA domain-containing protein [Myxococcales bacterium]